MALKPWIGATLAKEGFDLVHRALPTTRPPASKEITTTGSQAPWPPDTSQALQALRRRDRLAMVTSRGVPRKGSQQNRIDDKLQKGPGLSSSACRVARGVGRQEYPCARKSLCGRTTGPQRQSVGDRGVGETPDPPPVSESCLSPAPVSLAS